MNLREKSLDTHFNMAVESLRLLDFQAAIDFIDLAIAETTKKEFYMFQKAKILFVADLFPMCACYIEENLFYFYKHCSLFIFSHILYYYKVSSNTSTLLLTNLLEQNEIPTVLAYEYLSIFNKKDAAFLEKATDAMMQCDYTTCLSYCDLLFKQGDDPISVYLMKAKCYHLSKEYLLAIDYYKKALLLNSNLAPIYYNLGLIFMDLKQYAKAISYLQHATHIEPFNITYCNLLGEGFYKWKKYDSALIYFKKVISQDPNYGEAYLCIADIYNLINKPRKAKRYYKKVLQIQSHDYLQTPPNMQKFSAKLL